MGMEVAIWPPLPPLPVVLRLCITCQKAWLYNLVQLMFFFFIFAAYKTPHKFRKQGQFNLRIAFVWGINHRSRPADPGDNIGRAPLKPKAKRNNNGLESLRYPSPEHAPTETPGTLWITFTDSLPPAEPQAAITRYAGVTRHTGSGSV